MLMCDVEADEVFVVLSGTAVVEFRERRNAIESCRRRRGASRRGDEDGVDRH
jgi:hypothetical protein